MVDAGSAADGDGSFSRFAAGSSGLVSAINMLSRDLLLSSAEGQKSVQHIFKTPAAVPSRV